MTIEVEMVMITEEAITVAPGANAVPRGVLVNLWPLEMVEMNVTVEQVPFGTPK